MGFSPALELCLGGPGGTDLFTSGATGDSKLAGGGTAAILVETERANNRATKCLSPPHGGVAFLSATALRRPFIGSGRHPHVPEPAYPFTDFSRAWFVSLSNLTRHELVITAIALKRYAIRHGQPPDQLAALVPDFLTALPTDLMDGQPLRYRLNPDGTFVLYSVGANLQDDGGDFASESTQDNRQSPSPWTGRDWVWLNGVASVKGSEIPSVALQSGSK